MTDCHTAFTAFAQEKHAAVQRYLAERKPLHFFRRHAQALDTLLAALWQQHFADSGLCLLAIGGYGRKESYPHSDTDLAIVSAAPLTPEQETQISAFVQMLWDNKLNPALKSGSADELLAAARHDLTADTAFLEARFLCGNAALAHDCLHRFARQRDSYTFIEGKLLEMQQRHSKQSALPLEPNIKQCAGGLRDIHTMLWLARVQGIRPNFHDMVRQGILTRVEAGLLINSLRRLARIRIDLHLAAAREEDRLVFDLQSRVAQMTAQSSEKLMHTLYRTLKTVLQLNGIIIPMLRGRVYSTLPRIIHDIDRHYYQVGNKIAARDLKLFQKSPEHIFIILSRLQSRRDLNGIAPKTLREWWVASQSITPAFYQNPDNRRRFLAFFQAGDGLTHTMRLLNLYGVLSRYLPDWHKIVGLLQHDLFHIYPVDDHILTVLRNVRRLAIEHHSHELPFASGLMQQFAQPYVLYLAALFHDIAKGRNGDHAKLGVADARRFAADHGLPSEHSDLLAWLVEEHLLMSMVAQKEDITDPEVVERFCRRVGTHERLSALYLLTVADIRGTNPKIWNSWKAQLLEQLYHAAAKRLSGHSSNRETAAQSRQQAAHVALIEAGHSPADIRRLFQALGNAYFVRHHRADILWHLPHLIGRIDQDCTAIRPLPEVGSLLVMVYTANRDRLFTRLCRVFGRHELDIADARAYVSEHNFVLDTFLLRLPEHSSPDDAQRISQKLQHALHAFLQHGDAGDTPGTRPKASRRARNLPIAPHITLSPDEERDGWYTLELIAVNRPYLLADITEIFAQHHISLRYAKIATLADRVEDSFLIYAPKLAHTMHELALKKDLYAALSLH